MANEIISHIASVTAGRGVVSPVSNATPRNGPASVSARQPVAASGRDLPSKPVVETNAQLRQAASDINTYVRSVGRELQFIVDDALPLGRAVIRVLDKETQEVIREIPSAQALAIAHRLNDQAEADTSHIEGLILSAEA